MDNVARTKEGSHAFCRYNSSFSRSTHIATRFQSWCVGENAYNDSLVQAAWLVKHHESMSWGQWTSHFQWFQYGLFPTDSVPRVVLGILVKSHVTWPSEISIDRASTILVGLSHICLHPQILVMFPRIILFEISNVHQQILKSRKRPAAFCGWESSSKVRTVWYLAERIQPQGLCRSTSGWFWRVKQCHFYHPWLGMVYITNKNIVGYCYPLISIKPHYHPLMDMKG